MPGEIPEGNEEKGEKSMMRCICGMVIDPERGIGPEYSCTRRHQRLSEKIDRWMDALMKLLKRKIPAVSSIHLAIYLDNGTVTTKIIEKGG